MAKEEAHVLSVRTDKLRQELESWRKTGHGRVPERLWSAAVELARVVGVSRVARVLRLDYYGLKKRVQRPLESTLAQKRQAPSFVEVAFPSVRAVAQCTLKLEDPSGARLTVELPASNVGELAGIAKALWSGRL
jgi:hypothetical protein